ncbi:MAG TPA: AI-2E family transporter [Vicinamibacterales bacterium]|nr:AI-2E family transporter [Vicinamibacterales bacterium]
MTIAAAAALFVLHETAGVCVPVLVSLLLAYALGPFVKRLTAWHLPRVVAALLVYVLLAVAGVFVARTVRDQVVAFLDDLPRTMADIQRVVEDGRRGHEREPGILDRLRHAIAEEQRAAAADAQVRPGVQRIVVVPPPFSARTYIARGARGALGVGLGTSVVVVLTFLMLVAGDLFKRKIVKLAGPHFEQRKITVEVLHAIDEQIERYLIVRLIISLLVAGGTGVGLWLLGVHNPAVWGVIAGALNVLPFAGPGLAIALITLAAFLQFKTMELTIAAGAVASLVAFIEGNVLTPWLASRAGELNTVAVFVSLLFWGWLWGPWGLLLAVPIMVAVKAAADRIEPLQAVGELLGADAGTKT